MCLLVDVNCQIRRIKLFATLICIVLAGARITVIAEEVYPQCFPPESSWGNIEFLELPVSDIETPVIDRNRHLAITFYKTDATVPTFYGFTYLKPDSQTIPEITNSYRLEKHFRNVKLAPLLEDIVTEERSVRSYRFAPGSEGTWVIYLVAYLNKIPFLEEQGFRIYPTIERERGGTVFSGSSLNLAEMVDYKACVLSINQ